MTRKQPALKTRASRGKRVVLPVRTDKSNISAQENTRRAARTSRTAMPEYADVRTKFGNRRDDPRA
jgi:hypothetical protein